MSNRPHAAMIFAAGFGTRMMPLTADRPKPMVHVAGRPMIDHARDLVRQAGLKTCVSNLHYKADVLEHHLADSEVRTITETPDILDTGGGLRNAVPLLGQGPVVTINPDAIWHGPNPIEMALSAWNPDIMDALLVCVPATNARGTDSQGDFAIDAEGRITFGGPMIYGGVQIVHTDGLFGIEQASFSLRLLWDNLIAAQRAFACVYPGDWCDVGHPGGIGIAEQMIGWSAHD